MIKSKRNTSGYLGVSFVRGRWVASYSVNGRKYQKGFKTAEEANEYRIKLVAEHKHEALPKWSGDRVLRATKICPICEKEFKPNQSTPEVRWDLQIYCSPVCAKIAVDPNSWRQKCVHESKECAYCGKTFGPWMGKNGAVQDEQGWLRQDCCSQSCAKRWKNPMHEEAVIKKVSESLRRIKHHPPVRGGNGKPLPVPQAELLRALGEGWEPELVVCTGMKRGSGYPSCYKIDIGNAETKIGIEVDGASHLIRIRKEQDHKKDEFLATLGWKIYRVKNDLALQYAQHESRDGILTKLTEGSNA